MIIFFSISDTVIDKSTEPLSHDPPTLVPQELLHDVGPSTENRTLPSARLQSKIKVKSSFDKLTMTDNSQSSVCFPSDTSVSIKKHLSSCVHLSPKTNVHQSPITDAVEISLSPVKNDSNSRIPNLDSNLIDKVNVDSHDWLNDDIVDNVERILKIQSEGTSLDLQLPFRSNGVGTFRQIQHNGPFIQIINVDQCRWVTVSNIDVKSGCHFSDTVCIYDSARPQTISRTLITQVCSFFKSTSDILHFKIMNVRGHIDSSNCGVHAIAIATELASNCDPVTCYWNEGEMRQHLMHCIENNCVTRFPIHRTREIHMEKRTLKSLVVNVYCVCKMPKDKFKSMVMCDTCQTLFHGECMSSISCDKVGYAIWNCPKCMKD